MCLLSPVETTCTTQTALVLAWQPCSEIIHACVCVPCLLAVATIRGRCLFCLDCAIIVQGQCLFEEIR